MLVRFLLIFLSVPSIAFGQIPNYYYNIDFDKTGEPLRQELSSLISATHANFLEYTSSISIDTWDAIKQSDLRDGDSSNVLLLYGYNDADMITQNDRLRDKSLSCHTSSCVGLWNREHVFPRSKANPAMNTQFPGTGTDLHNLRAADAQMNGSRGNSNYSAGSGNSNSVGSDFYPGDEWRGDVARIIMYMYVRYNFECLATNVASGGTSISPLGDMPDILLQWNAQDSVSALEQNRNQLFFNLQGNRNPFIDNPYLATRIWSGPNAQNLWNVPLSISDKENQSIRIIQDHKKNTVKLVDDKNIIDKVKLYSIDGRLQRSTLDNYTLNLSSQSAGFYILFIQTKNGNQQTFKIIKN
jgi:endonuclease I